MVKKSGLRRGDSYDFCICVISASDYICFGTCFNTYVKRMKFGQSIREEGPQSHMKKTGTPTMGGLTFLLSIVITSLVAIIFVDQSNPIILLLFVTIGFGLIGFIDDYIIVVKKNNQGLTSKQKFLAQIGIAIIFFILSNVFHLVNFSTSIHIPFTNVAIPLSFAYVIFIVFGK